MSNALIPQKDIESFFDEGWITEVLFEVKSGKEATVYCCRADPNHDVPYFALKLYKPMAQRTFRNDAVYHEGRLGGTGRIVRAVKTKTKRGRAFQFAFWLNHEFATLKLLFEAGGDVPRPRAVGDKALLMAFIGDGDTPAPTLNQVRLKRGQVDALFDQALRNITLMLRHNIVHGDLSPYNVLFHDGRLVFIDFPQTADARVNNNARILLERDLKNICQYFARLGVACDSGELTEQLWGRFMRAEL